MFNVLGKLIITQLWSDSATGGTTFAAQCARLTEQRPNQWHFSSRCIYNLLKAFTDRKKLKNSLIPTALVRDEPDQ